MSVGYEKKKAGKFKEMRKHFGSLRDVSPQKLYINVPARDRRDRLAREKNEQDRLAMTLYDGGDEE